MGRKNNSKIILTAQSPVMTTVIKIVGNYCNLRCDYCFYHTREQQKKTVMSRELLEKFIKEYLELFDGSVRFTWHGGEPLLAGIRFFKDIIKFQENHKSNTQEIRNAVQTNGTLLNEEWAHFFKNHNFLVGVSLDGTRKYHDQFRKDKKGQGSFDKVIRGIKILQEYNVSVGILQVLTKNNISINCTRENFNFFVEELKIKRLGSLVYRPDENLSLKNQEITDQEYIEYLKTIIDLWVQKDDPELQIREIYNYFAGILGKQATLCLFNGGCTAFFCLEHDGKIYPCDRLSGNSEFLLGDLTIQSLEEILNGEKRLEWAHKANYLHPYCVSCRWKNGCHNGCPDYRNGEGKFLLCATRKSIFTYLAQVYKEIAEKLSTKSDIIQKQKES